MKELREFLFCSIQESFPISPIRIKCNSLVGETDIIEIKKIGKIWVATDVWMNCFTVSRFNADIKKQIYNNLIQ